MEEKEIIHTSGYHQVLEDDTKEIETTIKEDKFETKVDCLKYYLNQLDYLKAMYGKSNPLINQRNAYVSICNKLNIINNYTDEHFQNVLDLFEQEKDLIDNKKSKLSSAEREYVGYLNNLMEELLIKGLPEVKRKEVIKENEEISID